MTHSSRPPKRITISDLQTRTKLFSRRYKEVSTNQRCRRSELVAEECRLQPTSPGTVYIHLTQGSYRAKGSVGHSSSGETTFEQAIRPKAQLKPSLCRQTHPHPQSKPTAKTQEGERGSDRERHTLDPNLLRRGGHYSNAAETTR